MDRLFADGTGRYLSFTAVVLAGGDLWLGGVAVGFGAVVALTYLRRSPFGKYSKWHSGWLRLVVARCDWNLLSIFPF